MKKALAILFGLLFILTRFALSGPALAPGAQPAICTCCGCGGSGCCFSESSSSGSTPLPASPVQTGVEHALLFSATTSVAWTLPVMDAEPSSSSAIDLLKSAGVPLFTRHCALLI